MFVSSIISVLSIVIIHNYSKQVNMFIKKMPIN
nr:MAG TPA: hypothetical protein [Bacteriophage sp.]